MFETERTLYAFHLDFAQRLADGLDDARLADGFAPGRENHPAWILGHLVISTDYALQLLGRSTLVDAGWMAKFGPGTAPVTDRAHYPAVNELLTALARGHEAVDQASRDADPRRMGLDHPLEIEFLRRGIPKVGQLVSHLMTTHEAFHLGQFSAWRRAMGLPGVLTL